MNSPLQSIFHFIQQSVRLSDEEKTALSKAAKDADNELERTSFKLERTEKVKHSTAILLEQTIEELERERKTVEALNQELEIESALERVRAVAMGMNKPDDLLYIGEILFAELHALNFEELRNTMINIYDDEKSSFLNYDYSANAGKTVTLIPYNFHPLVEKQVRITRNASDAFYEFSFTGKELKDFRELRKNNGEQDDPQLENTSSLYYYFYSIGTGSVGISTYNEIREVKKKVLKRFRNVFDLAYKRYLDIANAEVKAREARIELGLERVRVRAMAMQKSDELKGLIGTIFIELTKLDLVLTRCHIMIFDTVTNGSIWWMVNSEAPADPIGLYIKNHQLAPYTAYIKAWKERNNKWQYLLEGKEKKDWDDFLFVETELAKLPDFVIKGMKAPGRVCLSASFNNFGCLNLASLEPLSNEQFDILLRFAKVFDLTYTRFNDLQKAEAQAREAQIQLALERVRARTMAMQKSDELSEAVFVLFRQFKELGENPDQATIGVINEKEHVIEYWVTMYGNHMNKVFKFSMDEPHVTNRIYNAWKEGKKSLVIDLSGKELLEFMTYRADKGGAAVNPDEKRRIINVAFFSKGLLNVQSNESRSEESIHLLERFAVVFEQTYTRFNDLKQAEAQAREAQIEAALERVRSKTMSMHKSTDLLEVISVLSEQFLLLRFKIHSANFNTSYRQKDWNLWLYNPGTPMYPDQIHIPYLDNPFFNRTLESLDNGADFTAFVFSKEEKDQFLDHLYSTTIAKNAPEERKKFSYGAPGFAWSTVYLKNTALTIANYDAEPYTEEQNTILRRFGNVFEQSYTRFLDLQKAEAQAREATIETALEKVRGNAMAMHNSNDLSSTASMVFTELRKLGINPIRCGVGLLNKESRKAQLYSATSSNSGDSLSLVGWVMLSEHPVLEKIYDTWLQNQDYFPELAGAQLKSYYELLLKGLPVKVPDWEDDQKQYGHFLAFSVGCLYAWSAVPYNDSELKILKRFATIIDLTFRRYIELQEAEANAREAIKRASLDRVRAETASMRTTADLEKITPLIWNELTTLGVPFIRCGVFIMDEEQELIHSFLSTPDGKAIAAFQLPYDSAGELSKVLVHWHKNEIFRDHWDEAAFANWTKSLVEHGVIASEEKYSTAHRPVNLDLHFFPFLQGMLYVGSEAPLSEEETHLVQTLADAFSTAYARYEDFNRLEAAKRQVDSTLNELQATQKQLIQSEKMASLGELTAGIAHEIQNPLNFVNNFSEVNTELIDELEQEVAKGNLDEVKAIAKDIKENEEKINHHGKRADAIVKGMLQHSRSSSGVKEPTDINALCEEYLRLSYHGLRAKDKSFNAEMKTDFDETIGKINIIPQDIGRVLLNVFNNAFYAVTERKNQQPQGYEPVVSVQTNKIKDRVEIKVSDNGNGIPSSIKEKIFQPFFTTKPTGQGTGLGLSLSYDIAKAHGGEIKVETKEGEAGPDGRIGRGSEFIIQLPII